MKLIRINKINNLILLCIASAIVFSIFTVHLSNSKYTGAITSEKDVLAIPILTLSNNNQMYSINNMIPGDEKEYTFSVSNIEEGKTNEILLKYFFKIEKQTQVPIEVKLYDITDGNEKEMSITNNCTEEYQMGVVKQDIDKITRKYKLKIRWNITDNDYKYSGKQINCKITLEGTQVI